MKNFLILKVFTSRTRRPEKSVNRKVQKKRSTERPRLPASFQKSKVQNAWKTKRMSEKPCIQKTEYPEILKFGKQNVEEIESLKNRVFGKPKDRKNECSENQKSS